MKSPDSPQEEMARLQTLWSLNILDTQPEEHFDRLTRMAKRLFGVPIALVSLVDENRQWFKSADGLSVSETPRDISFCGHAILGNDAFVIPDATNDDRFADNPLVLDEPNIRFYAGCPLKFPNGSQLGTLCIIDREPRSLSEEDLEILKDLTLMVERELSAVQLATLDELTNITNRRGFMLLAEHCLNLCARQRIPTSLVFADLNEFKLINDKFGHIEGDIALTAFANQMKGTFRNSDLFARLGGDEFVVLLTNTSEKLAGDIIAKSRLALEKYNREANRGYDISFSFGIVEFNPEKHHTVEALLVEGDTLMYKRKSQKDNIECQMA
ncbi:MAG: sensor domain-containing diguanylate cyclase [Pseudomonadales bacterium]